MHMAWGFLAGVFAALFLDAAGRGERRLAALAGATTLAATALASISLGA